MLMRFIYCSMATRPFSDQDIQNILSFSRRRNAELNVSGLLLYQNGQILQVLEGDVEDVTAIKKSIMKDKRHFDICSIDERLIDQRDFAMWSMAFSKEVSAKLFNLPGVDDFLIQSKTRPDSLGRNSQLIDLLRRFKGDILQCA